MPEEILEQGEHCWAPFECSIEVNTVGTNLIKISHKANVLNAGFDNCNEEQFS